MSIVFMECSIEMYYTERSGGRSSEEGHTQKRVGGFVSLQKIIICHFAAARPAWHLVRRIQTRAKCDLTEWRLPAEFRPGPQTDCRTAAAQLSTQSELPRPCHGASGWTDSMVAGQLRLLDSVKLDRLRPLELSPILTGRLVHATSDSESSRRPAWLGVPPARRPRAACNPEDGLGCHWQCVPVHSPILLRPNPPSIALARIWVTWTWSTPGPHHWQWLGVTSQPMSVYVCIYICKPMYTYTYVHIPTNTYIYIHIHQYTRIYCFSYLDFLTPTLLLYIHKHTYTYIYIHILQYTYIIHAFTYIYIHILTRAWRKLTDDVTIMICKLEHMYGDTCTIPRSMHARKDACSLFYINTWAMIWPVDYQAKASWWMKIKITMIGVPV